MSNRGLGKKTAKSARQTKLDILKAATVLFCEEGFDSVTLRSIASAAGTSHGLIRHHFGNKLTIWKKVSDAIHARFVSNKEAMLFAQPSDLRANEKLFDLITALLAQLLIDQRPMQLLNDAVQYGEELRSYFFAPDNELSHEVESLVDDCHQLEIALDLDAKHLKWLVLSSAYSSVQLRPNLLEFCGDNTDILKALSKHWQLFAQMLANLLSVEPALIPSPEIVLDSAKQFVGELDEFYLLDEG